MPEPSGKEPVADVYTQTEVARRGYPLLMALPFAILALAFLAAAAKADTIRSHGVSTFGDLSLPADFEHLPYVNPDAPKGGEMSLSWSSEQPLSQPSPAT